MHAYPKSRRTTLSLWTKTSEFSLLIPYISASYWSGILIGFLSVLMMYALTLIGIQTSPILTGILCGLNSAIAMRIVSCCVYQIPLLPMPDRYRNIVDIFDFWDDSELLMTSMLGASTTLAITTVSGVQAAISLLIFCFILFVVSFFVPCFTPSWGNQRSTWGYILFGIITLGMAELSLTVLRLLQQI